MLARAFNRISVNHTLRQLTKASTHTFQLKNEIHYYLSLPTGVASFFPRLISYEKDYSAYTLDYIPYQTLSQVLLENQISLQKGQKILIALLKILDSFHSFKPPQESYSALDDYLINKTMDRLKSLKEIPFFRKLFKTPVLTINDRSYKNVFIVWEKFKQVLKYHMRDLPHRTLIHGDFCLSNILYCPETEDIKLIDPRGSFHTAGLYGHPYYDYAKLMQGFNGRYDSILNNHYQFKEVKADQFLLKLPSSPLFDRLAQTLDHLFLEHALNRSLIYLIEASLFLSMVPLHYECLQRQKALFIRGIMLLNEALKETL